jgi:hypothetical protein
LAACCAPTDSLCSSFRTPDLSATA